MTAAKLYLQRNTLAISRGYHLLLALILLSVPTAKGQWIKVDSCPEDFGKSWRRYFIENEFQRFVFEADPSLNSIKNLPLLPACYRFQLGVYRRSVVAYHSKHPLISLQNIGVYRWNSIDSQWQSVFSVDNLPPMRYDTVTSIWNSDSLILIGTAFQGILRSSDLGNTWYFSNTGLLPINLAISTTPTVFSIIKTDSHVFIIGTSNGIYRSTDNALTWHHINGLPEIVNEHQNFLKENVILTSFGNNVVVGFSPYLRNELKNSLYRSTDNGESWSPIVNGIPMNDNPVEFLVGEKQKMIAVIDNENSDRVYYSKNSGESWTILPDAGEIFNGQRFKWCVVNMQILEGKLYAYTKDKHIWCYNLPD